jgi:hypothetical protein
MKAPLKQPYETRHAEDLTALKKLYEHHAKDCVRVAELTVDPRRREQYLKLAREWTEAAAALRVWIDERLTPSLLLLSMIAPLTGTAR